MGEHILRHVDLHPEVIRVSSINTALALAAEGYGVVFTSDSRRKRNANHILHVFSFGDQVVWYKKS